MFAALALKIRALPVEWQPLAWVGYGLLKVIAGISGCILWMLKEMAGQAAAGTKKTLSPLLWPAVAVLFLGITAASLGPDAGPVLGPYLVVGGFIYFAYKKMFGSKPDEKKKKKKKGH